MKNSFQFILITALAIICLAPDCTNSSSGNSGNALTSIQSTDVRLETTHDGCGRERVRVVAKGGEVIVRKGESKTFHVANSEFFWYCENNDDSDRERTNCADGTNIVQLTRDNEDGLTWLCYQRPPAGIPGPETTIQSGDVRLETTHDGCGRSRVRVVAKGGEVIVNKGETKTFFVANSEFFWYCEQGNESDRERTKCADETNIVQLSRDNSDGLTWICYRRP